MKTKHVALAAVAAVVLFGSVGRAQEVPAADGSGWPADAATDGSGAGGEFAPAWEEDEDGAGGDFAPAWEEDEDGAGGDFAPAWDDDGGAGGDFAPAWDDDGGAGGDFAPAWDDDGGAGGEFAPAWDDDGGASGDFAPAWDDDGGAGGDFAPAWDDDGGAGGDFAPATDDDGGAGGDFAPQLSDDDAQWLTDDDEDDARWLLDDEEGEDEDWDTFWEELEPETTEIEVPLDAPPATGRGRVIGQVVENAGGQPVYGAEVTLDETDLRFVTGDDGRFAFELDPGTYVLRARSLGLKPEAYEVLVEADAVTDLALIRLVVDEATSMTIVVEARADRESVAAQTVERRESDTVQDAVSAEQIKQSGDGSASGAVRRVVGATIVDGRFLFVRGLGGRYTNVTLNGVLVPRTDPVYPGVELDIFPTDLLSALTLYKNFTPDLPGAFVGGLMDIRTRSYPDELQVSLGVSISGDTMTTFQRGSTYDGGSLDWLSFDDGTRALPGAVPTDGAVIPASIQDPDGLSLDDIERIAESFDNSWELTERTAIPNVGVDFSVGDSVEVGTRTIGFLASFQYGHGIEHRLDGGRRTLNAELEATDIYGIGGDGGVDSYTEEAQLGALGTFTAELAEGHDLTALLFFNRQASDEVEVVTGSSEEEGTDVERTRLQFVERQMLFAQLLGSHRRLFVPASPWHETAVSWRLAFSTANRDEPDTRYMIRTLTPSGTLRWRPNPGSGERFFSTLQQQDFTGGLDLSFPWRDRFAMQYGGDANWSRRDFDARRFRYTSAGADPSVRDLPTDQIFSPENVGADGIRFSEVTQGTDSYVASQLIAAGYGKFEVRAAEWLRIMAGARYELAQREIEAGSEIVAAQDDDNATRNEGDILPAAGLVFTVGDDMYLRTNYGATVARPEVSEFAPFVTQDYVRRRTITGNPDLIRTYVHNADVRWEWFPSPVEVVSATAFYKGFLHPIESVVTDTAGRSIIFRNVESALALGGEVEGRISFGRVHDALEPLVLGGNVTVVHSRVEFPCTPSETTPGECVEQYTNTERAMDGQSPWVVNVSLGWEEQERGPSAFLFYNVFGRRIDDVGTFGRSDQYEEPVHQLDLSLGWRFSDHWKLSARARNLLLQDARFRVGERLVEIERRPLEFSVGFGWDL